MTNNGEDYTNRIWQKLLFSNIRIVYEVNLLSQNHFIGFHFCLFNFKVFCINTRQLYSMCIHTCSFNWTEFGHWVLIKKIICKTIKTKINKQNNKFTKHKLCKYLPKRLLCLYNLVFILNYNMYHINKQYQMFIELSFIF